MKRSLRTLLFGLPDGRPLRKRGRAEIQVRSLRNVLQTVREEKGLVILDRAIARNDLTGTRYGGKWSYYLSLDGEGGPYDRFMKACERMKEPIGADRDGTYGLSVPVGTNWTYQGRRCFIPFDAQVTGTLLWWYDTHKYVHEREFEERLRETTQKLPLIFVENETVNGAAYKVDVPNRKAGNSYHFTFYGIPVVETSATNVWRRIRWEQKTTHAQCLDAAQPGSGKEQDAFTAEAIAALYKIAFVAFLESNEVPRSSLPLLRPTSPLLKLDAALRRVRVREDYGLRPLRGNERSRFFGAALRQEKRPFYLFHQEKKITEISREEMEGLYSSSGL